MPGQSFSYRHLSQGPGGMEDPYARVDDLGDVVELSALLTDLLNGLPGQVRLVRDPRRPEHDGHDDHHRDRRDSESDRKADVPNADVPVYQHADASSVDR